MSAHASGLMTNFPPAIPPAFSTYCPFAGSAGNGLELPNAKIMFPRRSGVFRGRSSDIEIHAREALAMRK